jgi:hypothetical protein
MLQWLREAIQVLPTNYANFYLFCTLTGLRGTEAVEAVRLLNNNSVTYTLCYSNPERQRVGDSSSTRIPNKIGDSNQTFPNYYNPLQQTLEHFRFPDIFIRRTKAVYISIVNDEIVGIARKIGKVRVRRTKKAIR